MTDPLSLIALGAAVGGAAGKFTEKALDAGTKWIASYFKDHKEKTQAQAGKNATDFLGELAQRIEQLEACRQVSKETIESAQDHPDFSILLQKAILSAAQTDLKEKHQLLARLVAERLRASPESLLSLASKLACEVISHTNVSQLRILALLAVVTLVAPSSLLTAEDFTEWLVNRLYPIIDIELRPLDLIHLEALSCVRMRLIIDDDIGHVIASKNNNTFNNDFLTRNEVGIKLCETWKRNRIGAMSLTSIGQIIGVYAYDMVTNTTSEFTYWY